MERGEPYDVVVVGAGIGGIYAVYKFRELGLRVAGVEGAAGFGGVWYHNRYPGARVDVDSLDYSYYFSEELYRDWKWSERFATQPELMAYLNHVADRFDLRRHFVFGNWVNGAQWRPEENRYHVTTDQGLTFTTRFLVLATGNLSKSRDLGFPGLDRYQGEWVQTSHWPQREVRLAGRRVGVVGTGSSGVQAIAAIAPHVDRLHVFQRSPNYSIPAVNGPLDEPLWQQVAADVRKERQRLFTTPVANHTVRGERPTTACTEAERLEIMERQWRTGGHTFGIMFTDQNTDRAANDIVAGFVRAKIRETVRDPEVAEALCPYDHPIGTRRLVLDTGYYATYNRPHVTLVDLRKEPLETLTERGIKTAAAEYELDLVVFATGFTAFTGAIDAARITNESGAGPTDSWSRGPRTFLGLMTDGFPNLFFLTGPGSPSVLANMTLHNEFHVDWIGDLIGHMRGLGATRVEPATAAVDDWGEQVAAAAETALRRQVKNYMVHVNEDGTRVFMPYLGGFGRYASHATAVAEAGYPGLKFD